MKTCPRCGNETIEYQGQAKTIAYLCPECQWTSEDKYTLEVVRSVEMGPNLQV